MASESIGSLYPTEIPGYADTADIQAAFKLYHYGSLEYDTENTDTEELVNPSIAYTLNDLQVQITGLDPAGSVSRSIIDAKGDLIVGLSSDTPNKLSVGSNNFVLTADNSQTLGVKWAAPDVSQSNSVTLTNKTINLGSNTLSGTKAQFNTALSDADFATLDGIETFTNKTLTSPIISSISNTGTLTLPTSTDTLVGRSTTDTLINKTLTSPALTGTSSIQQIVEKSTVSAIAATGTINYDVLTNGSILYYTSNSTANWTLNIRGDGSNTLNSLMSTGQCLTVIFLVTNGSTAYYQTGLQIDGSSITPKWQIYVPLEGSPNAIDTYSVTIFKTGNATFTALESLVKFV